MADLLADFKATLETGNRLLQMQAYMHPPEIMKESIKGLAESLVTKACGIPFVSVEQVEALHTLITGSILEKDQQAKLTSVLTAKCFASTRGSGETQKDASVTKQAVQLMTAICAYMSQKDWVILEDPHHSTLQKIDTVCERCRKVGLTHPSEVTFKHLATLVARVHCAGSTPEQLYNLVRELKQAFAARKGTRVGCSRLPRFPESPSFLPDGVYECGYPDPDDQPAKRELDGLHQIFVRVPLRVSNKSIQSCSSSGASSSQLVAAPQPLQTDGIPAIMQALGGLLSQLQPAPGRQQGSPLITFLNGQQAPQTPAQGYGQAGAQGWPIAMPSSPTVALQGSSPPSGGISLANQLQSLVAAPIQDPVSAGAVGVADSQLALPPLAGGAIHAAGSGVATGGAATHEDVVARMLAIARGPPADDGAAGAADGAATAVKRPRLTAKTKAELYKKPAAASKGKAAGGVKDAGLILGCSKCRGTHIAVLVMLSFRFPMHVCILGCKTDDVCAVKMYSHVRRFLQLTRFVCITSTRP